MCWYRKKIIESKAIVIIDCVMETFFIILRIGDSPLLCITVYKTWLPCSL